MDASQPLRPIEFPEIAVERTKRPMASFLSNFQNQTIRKARCRATTKTRDGSGDHVRILQREVLMVQEHVERSGDGIRPTIVDGGQHPGRLSEGQMRDPRSIGDERFGGRNLARIIAGDQPHQHIRINGPHDAS